MDVTAPTAVQERVARLVESDGITYTPTGAAGRDDDVDPEPWQLDPTPLQIDAQVWDPLARSLAQLAAVTTDLAAPRTLPTALP